MMNRRSARSRYIPGNVPSGVLRVPVQSVRGEGYPAGMPHRADRMSAGRKDR